MISLELAQSLRTAGFGWDPAPGDHFVVPDRGLDERVFVISHMVVEQIETAAGPMLAFNGTTEWALDSVEVGEVVWLPLEHQLRDALGDTLVSLEALATEESAPSGFAVTTRVGTGSERYVDLTAEAAYARALLDRLGRLAPG